MSERIWSDSVFWATKCCYSLSSSPNACWELLTSGKMCIIVQFESIFIDRKLLWRKRQWCQSSLFPFTSLLPQILTLGHPSSNLGWKIKWLGLLNQNILRITSHPGQGFYVDRSLNRVLPQHEIWGKALLVTIHPQGVKWPAPEQLLEES